MMVKNSVAVIFSATTTTSRLVSVLFLLFMKPLPKPISDCDGSGGVCGCDVALAV